MITAFGTRQQHLLKLLLETKHGLTVYDLARQLNISRNAVRQHLTALELDGLVTKGVTHPTGGRPEQLYVLTAKGQEIFPRKYSWFSELLIESLQQEAGSEPLRKRFEAMGERVAAQFPSGPSETADRIKQLVKLMRDLGYESTARESSEHEWPVIEARNCVFHHLAARFPEVCHFDLALLEHIVQRPVLHDECIVKGGTVCRFKFQEDARAKLVQLRPRATSETKPRDKNRSR